LWLKIYPLTLGIGKKLFGDGTIPAAFKVTESQISPSGIIIGVRVNREKLRVGRSRQTEFAQRPYNLRSKSLSKIEVTTSHHQREAS
jgi:hypothetical protein